MGRACNMHVKDEIAYKVLIDKHEEKQPLERSKCRRENNINQNGS
jgi:hypothetical protein